MRPMCIPLVLLFGLAAPAGCKKRTPDRDDPGFKGPKVVRKMTKAGTWYSDDAKALGRELDRYVVHVALPKLEGRLVGLVSPHAGYRFSGPTAAFGFKLLGLQRGIKRVVVMGVPHRVRLHGVSLLKVTHYETPFGLLRVDRAAADRLRPLREVTELKSAHATEHSVELQLPFLKRVRPSVRILPMLVGSLSDDERKRVARELAKLVRPDTVFLASSDFTHRGQGFRFEVERQPEETLRAALKRLDFSTLPFIRSLDGNGLMAHYKKTRITMCGRAPAALMLDTLQAAGLAVDARVLHYKTSGDVLGDWRSTVSYLSIALMAKTVK